MLRQIAILLIGTSLALAAGQLAAEDDVTALVPSEHHEWGKFPRGAWKRVRLVTENLDSAGNVTGRDVTETTTTLLRSSRCSCTLKVDTIVELGGKRFAKPVQTITQTFDGTRRARILQRRQLSAETVVIGDRRLDSRVRSWTVEGGRCQLQNRLFYCRDVAPYVLKREITAINPVTQQPDYTTTAEVIALDVPHQIQGQERPTSHVRTVHQTTHGKTITVEVRNEQVPGGFVSHTSQRFDTNGQLTQRSTLELLDYFVPERNRPLLDLIRGRQP